MFHPDQLGPTAGCPCRDARIVAPTTVVARAPRRSLVGAAA